MTPPFGTPYWWQDGADLPDLATRPSSSCDILIVGGGFTGLSAAITAARAGARVIVVDAVVPGQGASTRNGGMVGAHARIAIDAMIASFGQDAAHALLNEAPRAYAYTKGFIQDENITCDFRQTGRVVLANTHKQFDYLSGLATRLQAVANYDMQIVPRAALGAHIASDAYLGAVFYPDHGGLQPRKFHDGLMAIALREGVEVVQTCPVLGIERTPGGFQARTKGGPIRAEKVILATNGYTRKPFRWLARRVFPLPSFIIATEPLDPARLHQLAPGNRMMVEARVKHSYYRISPDGTRIVFGGRAGMVPYGPDFAAKRLRATMLNVWPSLSDVKISHSWRGYTGFTFEQMPHVGSHEGMHFAFGYSGSGVALAPYLGMKAAYQALGDHRGETAYSRTTPTTRGFYPGGYPAFLIGGEVWYRQVIDRVEARAARRDL
jgi:glycine/D-amino acid oxidase-like deaminating enzyme